MRYFKCFLPATVFFSILILSGCQQKNLKREHLPVSETIISTTEEIEAAQLKQCQNSLDALQTVRAQQSVEIVKNFESLMKGAAQYSGVRSRVKNETQGTIDALYRYRVSKLCMQIDQALLLGLSETAESAQ